MLKIFTTQLAGLLKKIEEHEMEAMEDGARILAQAALGEGTIYICGLKELDAVALEATLGAEPLPSAVRIDPDDLASHVQQADRVLLFTRTNQDEEAITLATELRHLDVTVVAVSAITEAHGLEELVDVHINTRLVKGFIPDEDGSRYGLPYALVSLFVYHALAITLKEIAEEY